MEQEAVSTEKMNLEWVKPINLGIVWPKEQRLPDPHRELTPAEFRWLWFHDGYGLKGIHFEQLFMDWGKGPLASHPRTSWVPLSRTLFIPQKGDTIQDKHGVEYMFVDLTPDRRHVYVQRPGDALVQVVLSPDDAHVKFLFMASGGWDGGSNQFDVNFYWFHDKGLAVARRFTNAYDYEQQSGYLTGKGEFAPDPRHAQDGYALRYFRIGCEHTHMKARTPVMFEHHYTCPECGYHWVTWSD